MLIFFGILTNSMKYLLKNVFSAPCHEYIYCAYDAKLCFYDDFYALEGK